VLLEEKVGRVLRERGLKVGLAESCTGGLIADRITDVPGASEYFGLGVISYSDQAKEAFLSVPHEVVERNGAVSTEVAKLMAEGVRIAGQAHIGLSVTGIAGPGGGRPDKPVGTVYIGLSAGEEIFVRKFLFTGNRREIKAQASEEALKLLYDYLEGRP
jgi:PncC family amidohydrolase